MPTQTKSKLESRGLNYVRLKVNWFQNIPSERTRI